MTPSATNALCVEILKNVQLFLPPFRMARLDKEVDDAIQALRDEQLANQKAEVRGVVTPFEFKSHHGSAQPGLTGGGACVVVACMGAWEYE